MRGQHAEAATRSTEVPRVKNGLEASAGSNFVTPLALARQKEEHPHESQAVVDGALGERTASGRLGAECPDAELVEAALIDPGSFLALYERYFPEVQRYIRIRVADRAACEDITSEVSYGS